MVPRLCASRQKCSVNTGLPRFPCNDRGAFLGDGMTDKDLSGLFKDGDNRIVIAIRIARNAGEKPSFLEH